MTRSDDGAVGLASSRGPNHVDSFGDPVPSRFADAAEYEALVAACRGRLWQVNAETKFSGDATALNAELSRYADWSQRGGTNLTWTPFYAEPGDRVWKDVLAHNHALNDSTGLRVAPQITAVPITLLLRFDERSVFAAIEGWREVMKGFFSEDATGKRARLEDAEVRRVMKQGGGDPKAPLFPDFDYWNFMVTPSRPELSGLTLNAAAARDGIHPVDLLCDQVIADDFTTLIDVPIFNKSREGVVRFLEDDITLLGLGDSGAHVMSVTNYRYPTFLLEELVLRDRSVPIELAVNRMTDVPAKLHGLGDRGRIEEGLAADLCVIDPGRVKLETVEVVHDLPGGAPRLLQPGSGFRAVYVNGVRTIADDRPTGERPGVAVAAG